MSRAKDEREKVRAHKSAEPYFVLGHDFTKEEQMVADMNVPAKDYLGNPLTYPRNFSIMEMILAHVHKSWKIWLWGDQKTSNLKAIHVFHRMMK